MINRIDYLADKSVSYIIQVLKKCINIKTTCLNYIFKFRNTKSNLL